MLRAVMRNKTRFHHRYLGFREVGERHVCEEDEITSIFFDGLGFVDAIGLRFVWLCLRSVLVFHFTKEKGPDFRPFFRSPSTPISHGRKVVFARMSSTLPPGIMLMDA